MFMFHCKYTNSYHVVFSLVSYCCVSTKYIVDIRRLCCLGSYNNHQGRVKHVTGSLIISKLSSCHLQTVLLLLCFYHIYDSCLVATAATRSTSNMFMFHCKFTNSYHVFFSLVSYCCVTTKYKVDISEVAVLIPTLPTRDKSNMLLVH